MSVFLVSIGLVFALEIPTGITGFIAFGLHTGYSKDLLYHCTIWTPLDSGMLRYVIGSVFIPVYMCVQCSPLKRSLCSRMFTRLFFGIILWILGALSMVAIDLAGHLHSVNDLGTGSHCMFTSVGVMIICNCN